MNHKNNSSRTNDSIETLVELLRWRAKTIPDERAYTYLKDDRKTIEMTYGELDAKARALATSLQRKGLEGHRALLLYPPGLDYIVGFFGCLYANVIAVPAYPPDPNRLNRSLPRLEAIVKDSKTTIALTTDSILYMIRMMRLGSKLGNTLGRMPFLRKFRTTMRYFSTGRGAVAESHGLGDLEWISSDNIPNSLADDWKEPNVSKDTIAFLQYTSGSTGDPKGVILTHHNLLANSKIIYETMQYPKNGEGVFWIPIYHDMGLIGGVLQPLYGEVPSTLMSPIAFLQRPLRWLEAINNISKDKIIGTAAPNFAYELCLKKATPERIQHLDLSNWEIALSGAEPVRQQTIERFSEVFGKVGFNKKAFFPAYGLAEATLMVTGSKRSEGPVYLHVDKYALKKNRIIETTPEDPNCQTLVSSGYSHPSQRVAIVDPQTFKECKPGEIGEIWVHGPSVSRGYYGREKETKETFQNFIADTNEGPFLRTGDLGLMKEGRLFVTGRVKDLIIIRGTNHYPQDIELTVENAHEEVRAGCSAAFAVEENGQEELVVVAEVRHSKHVEFNEVIDAIRQAVTENHDIQPSAIVLIKARTINKTSSGKIQRQATKKDFLENNLQVVAEWRSQAPKAPPRPLKETEQAGQEAPPDKPTIASIESKDEAVTAIATWLRHQLAETLNTSPDEIDIRQPFISFGLDSAQAVGLAGDLEDYLGRTLPPTLIWDYPTIEELARHLAQEGTAVAAQMVKKPARVQAEEPIAVIGMGARFPKAHNLQAFWKLLKENIDGISEVPPERWDKDKFYAPEPTPGKMVTKHGGFIDNVDLFDAQFFEISPREAVQIDPQQRLLLEVTWQAFEHAGIPADRFMGSNTGVFIGISTNDYARLGHGHLDKINPYSGTGNAFSIAANRISYLFDLHGPSMSMDTACSSSLVAVHNACQSLLDGDCDMAVAGGVNLILTPELSITFSQAHMLAPDGRCKTFDASANGYGRGEGAGVVILKRLSDALRDGDRILAVIKGSAVNQDGKSNGITAPNGQAQQQVILNALAEANVEPDQIQYVETHGTGTILGDPIEIEALKNVMLRERSKDNWLYVGSVKTNIGHLESAAGIAGFIKAVLSLYYEEIPAHLHFKQLNPHIRLNGAPIKIPTQNIPWKRGERKRLAGVSAFGFGGTNAHVILEEAPLQENAHPDRGNSIKDRPFLLPVTAKSDEALIDYARSISHYVHHHVTEEANMIYDLLQTLSLRRTHMDTRLAVIAESKEELRRNLLDFIEQKKNPWVVSGHFNPNFRPRLVFVFSGQGPQWWAMGRELYQKEPIFRATIDRISLLLEEYAPWNLKEELFADEEHSRLDDTEIAQPALFALQVALSALWRTWGVVPDAVLGHSVGEVAAAHLAGILSLDTAVKVIYHRSRIMQQATGRGKMAAIDLPLEEVQKLIEPFADRLSIGAQNSVTSTVISGDEAAIDEVFKALENRDVFHKKLGVNYAFHSPVMDPYLPELQESLQGIMTHGMQIPIVSTVSGTLAQEGDYDARYWTRNVREYVHFSDAVDYLLQRDFNIFIEIGPHPVLRNYLKQNVQAHKKEAHILPSIRRKEPELRRMLLSLAHLYTIGYRLDWKRLYPKEGLLLDVPYYPFQKQRYWLTDELAGDQDKPSSKDKRRVHPLLGEVQSSPFFPANVNWSIQINPDYIASLSPNPELAKQFVPEAAYLEMAIAASRQIFQNEAVILEDVIFKKIFSVEDSQNRQLQFSLTPVSPQKAYFQAYSRVRNEISEQKWTMHSIGAIVNGQDSQEIAPKPLGELISQLTPIEDIGHFLTGQEKTSAPSSGAILPALEGLWSGTNEVLARINLNNIETGSWNDYHINPFILNLAFQLMTGHLRQQNPELALLTIKALKTFKVLRPAETEFWLYLRSKSEVSATNEAFIYDFYLLNDAEEVLLAVNDLHLRRFALQEALANIVYTTIWKPLPKEHLKKPSRTLANRWLIFDDHSSRAQELTHQLQQKGYECLRIFISEENTISEDLNVHLNPRETKEALALLRSLINENSEILYFWNSLESIKRDDVLSFVLNGLNALERPLKNFWLLTFNSLQVNGQKQAQNPTQAFLSDLAFSLEDPTRFRIKQIDLEKENGRLLFKAISLPFNEKRFVLREGKIYVERLARQLPFMKSEFMGETPPVTEQRLTPGPNELEIQIKAVSLNQRDLNVLQEGAKSHWNEIGFEFAGVVSETGANISGFKKGQRVMGLIPGGLRKYGLTYPEFIMPVPQHLSLKEAATLPYDYLTAHYALSYITRIEAGERLLIHNADTPTGWALLNVAKKFKAEVLATVRHQNNIELLQKAGASHVFSSKTPDYIDEILKLTAGEGVDIIANTGDHEQLINNFALLKDFGRFLELNPGGSFQQSIVYHNLRHNVSFFAIDLEHLARQQPKLIDRLCKEILPEIEAGNYRPLAPQIFEINELNIALSYLKSGRQMEKPVVVMASEREQAAPRAGLFRPSGSYLVLGNTSPVSRALLKWMRDNGAQHIRFLALDYQGASLPPEFDANIKTVTDISKGLPEDTVGIILSIDALPLQNAESIRQTIATVFRQGLDSVLDFFITVVPFKLMDIETQAQQTVHLNNFLMAFHAERWRQGLPSVHVELAGPKEISQSIAYARWQIIKDLLLLEKGHIILTEADWQALFSKRTPDEIPGFFKELLPEFGAQEGPESKDGQISRSDILSLKPEHRFERIRAYLASKLAEVIKVSADQIGYQYPLTQFGIDSLMAIELKNNIESQLGVNIPIATLLQGPSINDLASTILEQLEDTAVQAPKVTVRKRETGQKQVIEAPLSHGQRAMFFQHTMNPESIFNLAYAVRIRSAFDKERLRRSFEALVQRHPALRTTFHLKDGQPVQRIHPEFPLFFVEEDVRDLSEEALRQRLQDEVGSHFDLENGPLMRIFLFRRAENDSILLFVMHHIVTDIWSQAVLLDELSRIFEADGSSEHLPPLVADYTDFVRWQNDLLQSERGQKLFAFWSEKLAGDLPVLNLPTDRPRPPVQTFKGRTETLWLPEELSQKVHRFCEQQGVTPFTLLLAAYYILLHRYTQQNDIIVGSPTAGRTVNEFTRTVGYFVNPLPLRMQLQNDQPFDRFLQQVKETVLQTFENMDYPLTLLVEKLQPKRDPSRTPLFQTMFVLERAHLLHDEGLSQFALSREGARLNLGGLTIESMDLEQGVAPFDLTMMVVESGKGLAASLGYNVDLFNADTVQRMLSHYVTLIDSIVQQPQAPLSHLNILPQAERSLLLTRFARSADSDMRLLRPVHRLIAEWAQKQPQKTALIFEDQHWSYETLDKKANQLGHYLHRLGVGPDSIVGICLDRSPEMIMAILGVFKAGAAYLPIDPNYPPERIRYMIDDSQVRFIITDEAGQGRLHGTKARMLLIDQTHLLADMPDDDPQIQTDLKNLAYIIYTSGSTGKPKGTMLQHLGLANVLESTRRNYYVNQNSRTLQFASFSFDASVEEIFSTLTAGATLILARKETLLSLGELIELMKKHHITNVTLPPSVLNILQPEDFPSLTSVVSAGEKCHPDLARRWAKNRHFINGYGPTEATICTTSYEVPETFDRDTVPIGKPVQNVRVYVLDAYGNLSPIGIPGELYISGPGLARGYWNKPDLTAEKFIPNPFDDDSEWHSRLYRTGDLVRWLPDGNLEFLGRIDYQVKVRGFRIELGEIEAALLDHEQIKEAAVIAKTMQNETRLIAYYVPREKGSLQTAELKQHLLKRLPDYMIPNLFVEMDKLPLTVNGKIDRQKLPDPELPKSHRLVKPGTEIERQLVDIWKEVLKVNEVSVNDNFFELGGHSLGIVQVQGKIKEVFDRELNVVEMFKYPTIRSLAAFLGEGDNGKEKLEKVQTRASKQREATRLQQQRMMQRRKRK